MIKTIMSILRVFDVTYSVSQARFSTNPVTKS